MRHRLAASSGAVLAVLVLSACQRAEEQRKTEEETARRYDYVAKLADREGAKAAYKVMSRADIRFEDGFSEMDFDPPGDVLQHMLRDDHVEARRVTPVSRELFDRPAEDVVPLSARFLRGAGRELDALATGDASRLCGIEQEALHTPDIQDAVVARADHTREDLRRSPALLRGNQVVCPVSVVLRVKIAQRSFRRRRRRVSQAAGGALGHTVRTGSGVRGWRGLDRHAQLSAAKHT